MFFSRIVINSDTYEVLERVATNYAGPADEMKGGNSTAEMQRANQLSQQQLQQQQQQFQLQQQQLGMVNPSIQAIIQNGGMLPAQQAAMTSQALNGLGSQYQNLYGNLSQSLAARGITGGQNAGAGALAQSFGSLGAQEAGQQSQLLNQIQLAKGQGLQNAIGMGLGEGQMYGGQALGLGSQGVSALGIGQAAGQAADQAQTGFWGSLVGGLAGLGSSAITKWCWVASEIFGGWYTPETRAVRNWLRSTWYMVPFVWFYSRVGPRWVELIRRDAILRKLTSIIFYEFLKAANE